MSSPARIALAQIDTTVGDPIGNALKIRAAAAVARRAGARLVLFPELTLCGYPPRDFLDLPEFVARAGAALEELAADPELSAELSLLVGFPEAAPGAPPPGLYNSLALVEGGRVAAIGRKTLLPTYDVFDETRYFLPSDRVTATPLALPGVAVGLSVCEDVWNDPRFWKRTRYARDPVKELASAGAELVVNASASPYSHGKQALRERMLAASARDHGITLAYVNQVGGNDALIFDGGSVLVGRDGAVLARAPLFEEAIVTVGLDGSDPRIQGLDGEPLRSGPPPEGADPDADELFRALVLGVRDYVRKCGFKRAVVGLSGGIDSALTAAIAAAALGPEQVLGVAMPSRYSSDHSREDAALLARSLGLPFREIAIEPMHAAFLAQLEAAEGRPLGDLAEQNVQARVRGQILMALSNDTGALVLTTGNKSELAVGYCTLYGDMAGGLAVIGDLPKTWVYRVARAANARAGRAVIPERTFTKPPSAELKPGQLDQDSLPPYDVLDAILQAHVEERLAADAIVARGFDAATVRRVLRMVLASEYKRRQAAPVLKVTEKAFGEGRRFPIAHGYRY
ncbi:MAG TPA: NAD+ synthase [Anaeromyxobacteraceae bacterium]|nr:NAD+ synthase [Anaeromyxobacteraceae bacterium]